MMRKAANPEKPNQAASSEPAIPNYGWLKRLLLAFLSLLLMAAAIFCILWQHELTSMLSISLLHERNDAYEAGSVYTMKVTGGFYLEDFIAEGGVCSDEELAQFVMDKLTWGLIKLPVRTAEIGCASFTAHSTEGDVLLGRNYDLSKTNTCIVMTEATGNRHATISTVDLRFLGIDVNQDVGPLGRLLCLAAPYVPLDGMNDAGVACGIYMSFQGGEQTVPTNQNTAKPDLTSTTLLRLILDYADTVEDAVAIAESYDLHDSAGSSYHYMVADATGTSAILEWTGGADSNDLTDNDGSKRTLQVTYHDADDHFGSHEAGCDNQVITNFILQPGYYDNIPAEHRKGYDRYKHIWSQLEAADGILADEAAAMDILASVGRRGWNNDDSNSCTIYSAVYNLTDGSVLWVPNEQYEEPDAYYRFSLEP